ncbi:MAG: HAD family hydrolase [Candidatus Zixiibacteriota bacterium]|jgi:FMN phosphatase YigB (HAD superfamily)
MKISDVFLDAGGVLLDETDEEAFRSQLAVEALKAVIPDYNHEMLQEDLKESVASFSPHTYQYVFWKRLGRDHAKFHDIYRPYRDRWLNNRPALRLMSGIIPELKALSQHFRLGIAGQYGPALLDTLKANGALQYFTCRATQDEFPITKPDPRYLEMILQTCASRPECSIMVGDRVDNDVVPAKQLGMLTVRIRTGLYRVQEARIPSEVPDRELDSVIGLANTVLELARSAEMNPDS